MAKSPVLIVGAGLAGALLGASLAQRGWPVEIVEKRSDPRRGAYSGGRSINLALAERGLGALEQAGLAASVLARAVPMRGRLIHDLDSRTELQPYGVRPDEFIRSVHRAELNALLIDAAEARGCKIRFDSPLQSVDFEQRTAAVGTGANCCTLPYGLIVGCDGAGSALRAAMRQRDGAEEQIEALGHSYKELHVSAAQAAGWVREALHIWPRHQDMLIALPNHDGSFTATLFMPDQGSRSFAEIVEPAQAQALFASIYPDFLAAVPDAASQYLANPTGFLGTLRLTRWHYGDSALLLGDAAHAIVPFHGQGMNCAFEDVAELVALLEQSAWSVELLEQFVARRQPNAQAIAWMALDNYYEMRDRVADPKFLALKRLEQRIEARYPQRYRSRYAQVSFTRIPYQQALAAGSRQQQWLGELLQRFGTPELVPEAEINTGLDALARAEPVSRH